MIITSITLLELRLFAAFAGIEILMSLTRMNLSCLFSLATEIELRLLFYVSEMSGLATRNFCRSFGLEISLVGLLGLAKFIEDLACLLKFLIAF